MVLQLLWNHETGLCSWTQCILIIKCFPHRWIYGIYYSTSLDKWWSLFLLFHAHPFSQRLLGQTIIIREQMLSSRKACVCVCVWLSKCEWINVSLSVCPHYLLSGDGRKVGGSNPRLLRVPCRRVAQTPDCSPGQMSSALHLLYLYC